MEIQRICDVRFGGGAVPSWDYALKGLDQESGIQLDVMQWGAEAFKDSLRHAYQNDPLPEERLSDMVQHILYAMYAVGVMDWKEKIMVDTGEGFDLVDLSLPQGQDQLIDEIAQVNPNTIDVLQTGNAVHMPWKDKVKAILQAWFPGQGDAPAIAEILTGQVNPSGKLPLTFPTDLDQTPRPSLAGLGTPWGTPTTIIYNEGADVGYRWYANRKLSPMISFGYGLSYTHFEISHFKIEHKNKLQFSVTVKNTGAMKGAEVPQLYLEKWNETHRFRLVAFDKIELQPGESKTIHFAIDPRLIADFDWKNQHWRVNKGIYTFAIGNSSTHLVERITLELKENIFKD
ncbi:glycoside hydrolase family 3 C-terminal domain-containing protein [Faecalibacter sp. LW9]|uniref:glycoside hydrolase family 3 C-terminal domain-containing protein n=1 Tax=Faecalibacter sp. LW9 TaxID=3103144 RepID=UPI002AFE20B8|nr:glycoside hydrolase family 3 C-terminal domain-containing protein [Faecalibacter sp. LW9]